MNYLPALLLSKGLLDDNSGGVAVNFDGTLLASVHQAQHCVHIYVMDGAGRRKGDAVVLGTTLDFSGSARFVCFVHRNGIDTLLVCDAGVNDRVVEFTVSGVFLRAIALKKGSHPLGIAYCSISDVIAVSLFEAHTVVLLHYESGAVKPGVNIGLGTGDGSDDGQLHFPCGVSFTTDGSCILVADWYNDRVSKFSAASGAFIAHAATAAANGICRPSDVLQTADGSIVVAQGSMISSSNDRRVVCVGEDGVTVQNIIIPRPSGGRFFPHSLSYSVALSGVVVKTFGGNMFLLRDAWMSSNRCAWLSALATS
jgi:DNA-binding beta-propeller fold protein YncE